eukprot:1052412-Rhodomonas_salina.2
MSRQHDPNERRGRGHRKKKGSASPGRGSNFLGSPTGCPGAGPSSSMLSAVPFGDSADMQHETAQGLAGLRKRITGEADGEERSSVRRKKDAQFNLCETYQCIDPNENTMGGALARVQLGEISILAPTKWTKGEAGGDVLASWSDGTGSALKVEKQTVEASGLKWKRLAPGTIPAMAKSIIDLDIAQARFPFLSFFHSINELLRCSHNFCSCSDRAQAGEDEGRGGREHRWTPRSGNARAG